MALWMSHFVNVNDSNIKQTNKEIAINQHPKSFKIFSIVRAQLTHMKGQAAGSSLKPSTQMIPNMQKMPADI